MSSTTAALTSTDTLEKSSTPVRAEDLPSSPGTTTPGRPPAKRKSLFSRTLLVVIGIGVAVWGIHSALHAYRYESTDNAYVVGHVHQISSQIAGQVRAVLVGENQVVKAGDLIAQLDPSEFNIAVDKARAAVAQATAQEALAKASIGQAQAQLEEAQARALKAGSEVSQITAQLELARLNFARSEQLFANNSGATTRADVDQVRANRDATEAALAAARANENAEKAAVDSANAAQEASRAQADAARANVSAAGAALRDAERQLGYARITAPADGRIGNKAVEAGNRVAAGQTLFALAGPESWVVANFKETQLARMRVGQKVELTVDALPDEKLTGHIESFSPASGAQFALLPPDNATGNFNKVVQRVPVKIVLDAATQQRLGDRLRLGFSVIAEVRVR
ncbi:MAG: HlyD family secretion protein [Nibricoccus sp.]